MDPNNPDPNPPRRIVKNRWSYVPLATPIPLNTSNLVKLATASDPRSSSFVVYPNQDGGLFVWGLIDQETSYHGFVNREDERGYKRPGLFQASITGIGRIVVYIEYEKIAELKTNVLIRRSLDALARGPVLDALAPGIATYMINVQGIVRKRLYNSRDHWDDSLIDIWMSSLYRILLRAQGFRHGGAVLITPDASLADLNVKYSIKYSRLRLALETRASAGIRGEYAFLRICNDYLNRGAAKIPTGLYQDRTIARYDLEENRSELNGTLWFISLLTRVDGLVLLTPDLEVQGFGVEINVNEPPSSGLWLAGDSEASEDTLVAGDYNHYGTRHRSMMRYCSKVNGSVGFVISQDGDVRAITQVRGKLVMWDNI